MAKKKRIPQKLQPWIEARKKFKLSHAQIQMARELGLNPRKMGGYSSNGSQQWKLPLGEYIVSLYEKRFGKRQPEVVRSIEEIAAARKKKKEARQSQQQTGSNALSPGESAANSNQEPKRSTRPTTPCPPSGAAPAGAQPIVATSVRVDSIACQSEAATEAASTKDALTEKDQEQAQLFSNRLVKLARHLRRWPTKRGITCFRLYEKDIPEIPLVVDRYEDYLHITEYERPHQRSPERHAAWLELMKQTAAIALQINAEKVHLKQRAKNREGSQYEKQGSTGQLIEAQEAGLKFLVNLQDYVDTGLFLDHRNTRQMVREEAKGVDFLNLFAYTGSFSVYAAAGQARTTTTVDLSKNYLDWAKRNFAVNRLSGTQHQFIASDALQFLRSAKGDSSQRYGLAVVDPPTYSNSKRTEDDWDIQKQHVELLGRLREIMRPAAIVYFSTNFRRFQFDQSNILGYDIREISRQTVPEDFRNHRIHRCWKMVVR